jgi:hypothetical protein
METMAAMKATSRGATMTHQSAGVPQIAAIPLQ